MNIKKLYFYKTTPKNCKNKSQFYYTSSKKAGTLNLQKTSKILFNSKKNLKNKN